MKHNDGSLGIEIKTNKNSDYQSIKFNNSEKDAEQMSLTLSISDNTEHKNASILDNVSFEIATDSSKFAKKLSLPSKASQKVVEIPFHEDVNHDNKLDSKEYSSSTKK